jgi:hypothetical protein
LAQYTYGGDFNYDGVVDADDYFIIDNNLQPGAGIGASTNSGIGRYRFLGVKRGTVIIGGAGSTVADIAQHYVTVTLLATKSTQTIRLAGYDRLFTPADDVIDSLPAGGPKVRGILVEGGAIWLPTDGTEPYFSSGKK